MQHNFKNINRFILLLLIMLSGRYSFSQTVIVLDSTNAKFANVNGVYHYFDADSLPLTGTFKIPHEQTYEQVQIKDGVFHGEYLNYTNEHRLTRKYFFENGYLQGRQFEFYSNGQVKNDHSSCYNRAYGPSILYDEEGKELKRIYSIYSATVNNEEDFNFLTAKLPCLPTKPNLPLLNKSSDVLPGIIDTISVKKGIYHLARAYPAIYFLSAAPDLDTILFTILSSQKDLSAIAKSYKPQSNEIAFIYGISMQKRDGKRKKTRQFIFKLGDKTKTALFNRDITDHMMLVFLEHKIFGVAAFSGFGALEALDNAVGRPTEINKISFQ